jgi:hypothetical protein
VELLAGFAKVQGLRATVNPLQACLLVAARPVELLADFLSAQVLSANAHVKLMLVPRLQAYSLKIEYPTLPFQFSVTACRFPSAAGSYALWASKERKAGQVVAAASHLWEVAARAERVRLSVRWSSN